MTEVAYNVLLVVVIYRTIKCGDREKNEKEGTRGVIEVVKLSDGSRRRDMVKDLRVLTSGGAAVTAAELVGGCASTAV